jgi:hypothetical protein
MKILKRGAVPLGLAVAALLASALAATAPPAPAASAEGT